MFSDPVPCSKTLARNGSYIVKFVRRRTSFDLLCLERQVKLVAIRGMLILKGGEKQAKQVDFFGSWQTCHMIPQQ